MRILFDECVPRKLKRDLEGHDIRTVPEMGWSGIKNGELLKLAASHFDLFLTVDRNMPHQQNTGDLDLAIVVLVAKDNRRDALRPLMPEVQRQLGSIQKGEVRYFEQQPGD